MLCVLLDNKDKNNSLKTLNDKNHQATSQKFRQLLLGLCIINNIISSSVGFISFEDLSAGYHCHRLYFLDIMR